MDRKRVMEEAIHSGEMEGAYVSAEFRKNAEEYVQGEIPIDELMARTKRRWKTEKKGNAESAKFIDPHIDKTLE